VPPGAPQADPALSGQRPAGAAGGPVPGRMTGIRSCWALWRPGWSPSVGGMIGSQPVWCSRGGRSWSVATSPSMPSRCLCTRGNCWSAPVLRPGQPSCGCCSVSSSPGSLPVPAEAWSPEYGSRAQRRPLGCGAPATSAAVALGTPTANAAPSARMSRSQCSLCRPVSTRCAEACTGQPLTARQPRLHHVPAVRTCVDKN